MTHRLIDLYVYHRLPNGSGASIIKGVLSLSIRKSHSSKEVGISNLAALIFNKMKTQLEIIKNIRVKLTVVEL